MNRFKLSLVAIVIFSALVILPVAKVIALNDEISWSNNTPDVYKSEVVSNTNRELCMGLNTSVRVGDEMFSRNICVTKNINMQFGGYYSEGSYRVVVGFGLDNHMYPVDLGCAQVGDCYYSADYDTLILKKPYGLYAQNLSLYKNFSKRLLLNNGLAGLGRFYYLDNLYPDYTLQSSSLGVIPVGAINISRNGKWLIVEIRNGGIALLNLENLNTRRVISDSFLVYGYGYDPRAQLAVSDDGMHIAVMGVNSGFMIVDVVDSCGEDLDNIINNLQNSCIAAPIDTGIFISNFRAGYVPEFNESGSQIKFQASSYTGEFRDVILRTKGYSVPIIRYLAIGDSYSSGEGDSEDVNYGKGTNIENEKCHLSGRSYPFVVAYTLNMGPSNIKSVACSGATTSDIVGIDGDYWGQGDRLISLIPNKSLAEKENLQSVAKDNFLPGRVRQETFVKDYQPKVITVGIGGNDVGFADKLQACLGPDTCNWAGTIEGREKTAVEMKGLFNKLVTTYQNLQNDSPDSKIYAIGYPRFIEPSGECSSLRELLLDSVERRFIDEGIIYLSQIIKAAAKKVGIKYISIEDSYGNHRMCGSDPEEAANFIKAGDDIGFPGDWLSWVKLVGQESFHPNALGHQLAAGAILTATNGNIETYDYCNGQVSCPQNVSAPEPSSYWLPGAYHNYPEQKLVDFVSNIAWIEMRYAKINLRLAKYALMPYSIVDIEINSTPRSLGQYTVVDDGSFNIEVDLPEDLEEGYHTVHIYGKSYSGENVDLYQVIGYFKPEAPTNEEPMVQLPITKNDTKNQIVSISNNNIQTDEIIRVNGGDLMKDSFGVWSSGMFIDNNITSAGHVNQSILSTATIKKEKITEKSLGEQADDAMQNVIVATICALFAAITTAVIVRFNRV